MLTKNSRTADHDIDPLFLERWSPRAFDGSALSDEEIATLLEAARWAPSSYNAQPWRFVYARRDTPAWDTFVDLLVPFNQSWAKQASLLVIALSEAVRVVPGKDPAPSYSHSFDTGAAWMAMALQATRMGLAAHGMVGFDIPRTAKILHVPDVFRVEAAIAIGRPADKSILPEALQEREVPSPRRPLTELVYEGAFPAL